MNTVFSRMLRPKEMSFSMTSLKIGNADSYFVDSEKSGRSKDWLNYGNPPDIQIFHIALHEDPTPAKSNQD